MSTPAASNPALYEIRNWDKYQSANTHKWIKDYSGREDDSDFSKLSIFQRGLLEGICRLRARTGKPICVEPTYIARALHTISTDRPHLKHAIGTLISHRFLVPCNQQDDFNEIDRVEESKGEESKGEVVVEQNSCPLSQNQNLTGNELQSLLDDMRAIYEHNNVGSVATWNTSPADDKQALLLARQYGKQTFLLAFDCWCSADAWDQTMTRGADGLAFPVRKFFTQTKNYVEKSQTSPEVKRRSQPNASPIVREFVRKTDNQRVVTNEPCTSVGYLPAESPATVGQEDGQYV